MYPCNPFVYVSIFVARGIVWIKVASVNVTAVDCVLTNAANKLSDNKKKKKTQYFASVFLRDVTQLFEL